MNNCEKENCIHFKVCEVKNYNYACPYFEPERPKGEWITVEYARTELNCPEKSMLDFVKCPFCETIHQGRRNFCSRCGADMRGTDK